MRGCLTIMICLFVLWYPSQTVEADGRNEPVPTRTQSGDFDQTSTIAEDSIPNFTVKAYQSDDQTIPIISSGHTTLPEPTATNITIAPKTTQVVTEIRKTNSTMYLQHMSTGHMTTSSEDINNTISTKLIAMDPILELWKQFQYVQDMFILPCLCPIGIIGNSLVVHTLVQKRKAKTANRYMITILVTDVCSLLSDFILPGARILAQSDSWSIKEVAGHVYYYTSDGFTFLCRRLNLNVFCVLSVERLIAITKPFEVKQSRTATKFHWFIIASFTFALLQSLPFVNVQKKPFYNELEDYTSFIVRPTNDLFEKWYFSPLIVAFNIIDGPFQVSFLIILNVLIVRALMNREKLASIISDTNKAECLRSHQKKIVKIFLVLSITNILAFLPKSCGIIVHTILKTDSDRGIAPWLMLVVSGSHFLRVLNSLTDFIVFLALSNEIRSDVKKMFKCKP